MAKDKQQPVRLYVKGVFTGYKRSIKNQYNKTALLKLEGVKDGDAAKWYLGKRVAYIYRAQKEVKGSKFRCIWGKVTRTHGAAGTVRAQFRNNLPPRAMGATVRDNNITIDGPTDLSFTEDVGARYEAYGWQVLTVTEGNGPDMATLRAAIQTAKETTDRPTMIKVRTVIGFGAAKENTHSVHGSPIGDPDIASIKAKWGFDPEKMFNVEPDVQEVFDAAIAKNKTVYADWQAMFKGYSAKYPELAADLLRAEKKELPAGWDAGLPTGNPADKARGTRNYSQDVLAKIVPAIPELVGGSADLTPSNLTKVEGNKLDFTPESREGRYLRFGVREHGMCSIVNGMAAYGGLIPYCATFVVFTGYCIGAIRVAALSKLQVLYVFTHDSIGLGEDGPTHQPIETLTHIRVLPNILCIRPADQNETSGAYKCALEFTTGPTMMMYSRQASANEAGTSIAGVASGAYTISSVDSPALILTASGTEVQLVVAAAAKLNAAGVKTNVVSFPCWELYDQQSDDYKESVFPTGVPVMSVEMQSTFGWAKYAHCTYGIDSFGESGPGAKVIAHFGFTEDKVVDKATKVAAAFAGGAPNLRMTF